MKSCSFSLALLILIIAGGSAAAQIRVTLPEVSAKPGEDLALPLRIGDLTGQKVTAFELVVSTDTNVVVLHGVDQHGTLSEGLTMFANNRVKPFTRGRMKIVCAGAYPLVGSGTLVKILATVKKKEGVSALILSDVILNSGQPKAQITSGKVTVRGASTLAVPKKSTAPKKKTKNEQ